MSIRICLVILICYLILFFFSRGQPVTGVRTGGRKPPRCFMQMAALLLGTLSAKQRSAFAKTDMQIEEELSRWYPDSAENPRFCYRRDKLAYALMIAAAGTLLSLGMCVSSRQERRDVEHIIRGGYGSAQIVTLIAQLETANGSREETVPVTVKGKEYTKEQIDTYMEEIREQLPEIILGENEDIDHVAKPLDLIRQMNDNPVTISWSSSDYGLIDSRGEIQTTDIAEEGALCMLTARLSCQGYEEEELFYVRLCRGQQTQEDPLLKSLRQALQEKEEENRTTDTFTLPQEVDGNRVVWIRKTKDNSLVILMLTLALAAGVYLALDSDLKKQIRERRQRLLAEYPEFVSRLVLLMSAGMTIRGAMQKMAGDYEERRMKRKNMYGRKRRKAFVRLESKEQIYEEVAIACHELNSGIPEAKAYYRLGRRCGEPHYVRLCMLLSQNLKKGTAGLLILLKAEALDALEERKRNARRLGEEAGTKLLLPMMIMLVIVMVIIMIPAFWSFAM